MRNAVVVAAALALSPTATAAPPSVTASASTGSGAAPLTVVFSATGDAAAYHWDFGDGASAEGPAAQHVFRAGAFTARLTATSATGEAVTRSFRVLSFALALRGPTVVTYRRHLTFRGRLVPALRRMRVGIFAPNGARAATGLTRRGGRFQIGVPITKPGVYTARYAGAVSNGIGIRVRPTISSRFVGSGAVGRPLHLVLRLQPAAAGPLYVAVRRNGRLLGAGSYASGAARLRLPSRRAASYRIVARTAASPQGFARTAMTLRKIVFFPRLSVGSRGPSVLALNQGLDRLHIALGAVDSSFGLDTRDAVVAFQKLQGLPRTGAVDARFWRRLTVAQAPRARYPYGDHIEVSKARQVLLVVGGGRVMLVSHVSTGATGNTPAGRWHVYSKVPGWLPSGMFDSSFFLRGFAIHGYPTVPFSPASHGCVRVPVWLAPRIYAYARPGMAIYVY